MPKTRPHLRTGIGILLGSLLSIGSGFIYLRVLHAPSSSFYYFAISAFFLGPIVAGVIDASINPSHKIRRFMGSGGVTFGFVLLSFFLIYAVLIRLFTTSIPLPSYCDGTYNQSNIPAELRYVLPDGTSGISIDSDDSTVVVVTLDYNHPPHPGSFS